MGLYALITAGYRTFISLKALKIQVDQVRAKLDGFEIKEAPFKSAEPSRSEELPKLLRVRRSQARAKEQALEERRRRLLQRMSSINIDKRSA